MPVEHLRKIRRSRLCAHTEYAKARFIRSKARSDACTGVWLSLALLSPAMTEGETLARYNPASSACYKPLSVTALSSAAATTKERAGSIP
jgi:hypothetical protein